MSKQNIIKAKVVVLGSGPGGYSAAFRAADLFGEGVVLIEQYETLGGVCLNVGCIPSKTLLHVAEVIKSAQQLREHGVEFGALKLDVAKLKAYKGSVLKKLTGGLAQLAKQRQVTVVHGYGKFALAHTIEVNDINGVNLATVEFEQAIIAVGSRIVKPAFLPDDPRIWFSTAALELQNVPKKMLVLGGGIIGMEMAEVYSALGSEIHVVELMNSLLGPIDKEVAKIFYSYIVKQYAKIRLETKVAKVDAKKDGLYVTFVDKNGKEEQEIFDVILCAIGRIPNGDRIEAAKAAITVDERGFIRVDKQQRTNISHIFAIGDVVGQPMLAHKATHEGIVAAEVAYGKKHYFMPKVIPAVAYTNPEVAWVGLTEEQALEAGIDYGKASFPWAASGRALSLGRGEGLTKLLFDAKSKQIIGASIIGPHAGDLIAELTLAIEMGCEAEDLALTIHPHPTLSETVANAAEVFAGTIIDLYLPSKKSKQ